MSRLNLQVQTACVAEVSHVWLKFAQVAKSGSSFHVKTNVWLKFSNIANMWLMFSICNSTAQLNVSC